MNKYRNCLIGEINGKTDQIKLAGRVIGLVDEGKSERGFILEDFSGRLMILSKEFPNVGAIVSVQVKSLGVGRAGLIGIEELVGCEDFYVGKSSPNFIKASVDLNLKEKLVLRAKIIAEIRRFFEKQNFLELDTPNLVKYPGQEPYLDVFKSEFKAEFEGMAVRDDLYLITSPEYALKKYLVAGFEKIFQVTKSFRNKESFSNRHNPEFTILEWYRAYSDYREIMADTEELVKYLWAEFRKDESVLKFNGCEVDMKGDWEKLSLVEAFEKYAGILAEELGDEEKLRGRVKEKGYALNGGESFDDLFFVVFLNEIEPKLGRDLPVVLYDYPISMAALSKPCVARPGYAERFEVYIAGLELCNAFSELNDWKEQQSRLEKEREERNGMGKDVYDVDVKFIEALKFGMPPSGGNALGVDRLVMLLVGEEDIRNVLYLPYRDL
ncbi:MAG: EF-P lysine aminoacylase EpmA [Candidatus Altimarinota bacterium]